MTWQQHLKLLFITCSDFTYLSREEKCENYGHTPILQALTTVTVPVTEPGAGPGTGLHWWFRYRIALVVPVPVPDCTGGSVPVPGCTGGSGTGTKFSSGPNPGQVVIIA